MSFAQLEYFVAVVEERHIGRAAARLHVSQPPLTRQIRALEEELGLPLFERTPRGMHPLPAAERLMVEAQSILAKVRNLSSICQGEGSPLLASVRSDELPPPRADHGLG